MEKKSKYLEDIALIKDLLLGVEEKSLIEFWTFYVWGIVVIAGTFLHWYFSKKAGLSTGQFFYFIWLPVIFVCGLTEVVSWVRKAGKESRPLFTRPIRKYLSAWFAILFSGVFLIILLVHQGQLHFLPVAILSFSALVFIFYGMISYSFLLIEGYVMIFAAFALFFLKVIGSPVLLICGISGGLICFLTGIIIQWKESHGK